MKSKKKIIFALIAFIIVIFGIAIFSSISFSAPLENDVKVEENSELIYYIDVSYDGIDGVSVSSSDTATADVFSDYIYVEDMLPNGLIFDGFVETEDGTIGAVRRSDNVSCPGYVEGGVSGLTYNSSTRTVSFRVKNLKAGCHITVGIRTITPSLGNSLRMDFYNTAYGREGKLSVKSNTVHVFMGREDITRYNVSYQYTGIVPDGAPEPPVTTSYIAGDTVGVSQDVDVEGYTFSGWSTSNLNIYSNTFVMPNRDVVFTGSFSRSNVPSYDVVYSIQGDVPDGYRLPSTQEYRYGSDVVLDSLTVGEVINGYRFLGWTTADVNLPTSSDDESIVFSMPNHNVTFVGQFERIGYEVSYQFQGSVLPPNASSLLPETKVYYPGDTVTLADNPEASGYRFLGWYQENQFIMPEEDIVIYGEWAKEVGTFSPTITKEIVNPQSSYQDGDIVTFHITVTNTAPFTIEDVMLEEQTKDCHFIAGDNYAVLNDKYVRIPSITSGASVVVSSQYIAGDDINKNITNTVQLTGAIASNDYSLDISQDYTAKASFIVSNISLGIIKINENQEKLSNAEFTLYRDRDLQQEVSRGLTFHGLTPNTTYYLVETRAPTGYQLLGTVLKIDVDSNGVVTIPGYSVTSSNGENSVSIINQAINVLPNTGGIGIVPYIVVGLLFVIVGVVCCIRIVRKRGDEHKKDNS